MNSSPEKPVLFVLLSRFPYPLEKGDKLRAYYQLRELSSNHNIVLICLSEEKVPQVHYDKIKVICADIHVFRIRKITVFIRLFFNLFTTKPFQVAYFYSLTIQRKINKLIENYQPDHIFCQLIRTTEYVKDYHRCPKTIDYMDALSIGMERRSQRSSLLPSLIWKEEAKRLRNYERKIFDYFEGRAIISEQDRSFIVHPESKSISVIPNGIDTSFFEKLDVKPTHDLVFVGNLSYPPNIEAATFLAKSLLPAIPGKKLLLAGATPDKQLVKWSKSNKDITLLGWTDDIRLTYKLGDIFIAPMHIGTGMQNKILEAMALGVPCITTSLANNAIKGVHREHLLVADTLEEMTAAIEEIASSEVLKQHLTSNARTFVQSKYSWISTVKQLDELLRKPH